MFSLSETHPLYADSLKSLDVLDWQRLMDEIVARCPSVYGETAWHARPFLEDSSSIQRHQSEVGCLAQILQRYGESTHQNKAPFRYALPALNALAKDAILGRLDFVDLLHGLHHGRHSINHVLKYRRDIAPHNTPFTGLEDVPSPVAWWTFLDEKLTPEGEIRDSASPELAQLKKRAAAQETEIQSTLKQLLSNSTVLKALQEAIIVQRNGRYVLPVNVFYKTSVPGIVHDVSSSGSTVFIEPKRVVELSNRLQETHQQIQKEEARILKEMSEALAPHAEALIAFFQALEDLERQWAAARLAKDLDAVSLKVLDAPAPCLLLKNLKHPLLCLQEGKHAIIANTVTLGGFEVHHPTMVEKVTDFFSWERKPLVSSPNLSFLKENIHCVNEKGYFPLPKGEGTEQNDTSARCMVITGPNTGGKTVLLKSVGLAVLMVQAGMLPVVEDGSSMSLFTRVLADIGDSQSLQHNLSTFSGQMSRLARFADASIPLTQTLILLDEIAAGTDPIEGSALAQALLKRFYDKGAMVIVTTHLGVLKQEAHRHEGYVNASVAFDVERLAPTYRLLIGVPGASNALAIAERLGLDRAVIEDAHQHMGQVQSDSATLLTALEQERLASEETNAEIQRLKDELEKRHADFKAEQQAFREKKKQLLSDYQAQFKARLRDFEDEAKRMKKDLKKAEESPKSLAFAQQRILRLKHKVDDRFQAELAPLDAELLAHEPEKIVYAFEVGQDVKHPKLAGKSQIVAISSDGKKVTLKNGMISLVVKTSEVEPLGLSPEAVKAVKKAEHRKLLHRIHQQHAELGKPQSQGTFALECNVRGKRAIDALEAVQAFLDNAHRVGLNTVGIVHGQGTGALKKAVRDYLKTCPFVKDFYPEQAHLGGDGKTIVEMKE
jgi:DNA mismatch repair protein MutS2